MAKPIIYRQGDVLLRQVGAVPATAKEQPRDKSQDRVVLAYGEATGHAHALHGPRVALFRDGSAGAGGATYLRVEGEGPVALEHEEHRAIPIPPGTYAVVLQPTYPPGAVRQVPARRSYPLHAARAAFSQLVERALAGEPQRVTRHGKEAVLIVAEPEWRARAQAAPTLGGLLARHARAGIAEVTTSDRPWRERTVGGAFD